MSKKIKANDTFMDSRCGLVHAGQTIEVADHLAQELAGLGFVKIVGDVSEKPETVSEKAVTAPENKMVSTEKVSKKKAK